MTQRNSRTTEQVSDLHKSTRASTSTVSFLNRLQECYAEKTWRRKLVGLLSFEIMSWSLSTDPSSAEGRFIFYDWAMIYLLPPLVHRNKKTQVFHKKSKLGPSLFLNKDLYLNWRDTSARFLVRQWIQLALYLWGTEVAFGLPNQPTRVRTWQLVILNQTLELITCHFKTIVRCQHTAKKRKKSHLFDVQIPQQDKHFYNRGFARKILWMTAPGFEPITFRLSEKPPLISSTQCRDQQSRFRNF